MVCSCCRSDKGNDTTCGRPTHLCLKGRCSATPSHKIDIISCKEEDLRLLGLQYLWTSIISKDRKYSRKNLDSELQKANECFVHYPHLRNFFFIGNDLRSSIIESPRKNKPNSQHTGDSESKSAPSIEARQNILPWCCFGFFKRVEYPNGVIFENCSKRNVTFVVSEDENRLIELSSKINGDLSVAPSHVKVSFGKEAVREFARKGKSSHLILSGTETVKGDRREFPIHGQMMYLTILYLSDSKCDYGVLQRTIRLQKGYQYTIHHDYFERERQLECWIPVDSYEEWKKNNS